MRFDLITIFPEFFDGPLDYGIVRRAREAGLMELAVHDLRNFTHDRHRTVDDRPFGGGEGMVLKLEPIFEAVETLVGGELALEAGSDALSVPGKGGGKPPHSKTAVVLLSAAGKLFRQETARRYAQLERVVLICGRYEGVDERVAEHLATDELSIGDFVLSGGELPAALVVDAVTRLLPGALGNEASAIQESFGAAVDLPGVGDVGAGHGSTTLTTGGVPLLPALAISTNTEARVANQGILDYPHYTRPAEFRGWDVPEVLVGGNHAEIRVWRRKMALAKTLRNRPDLLVSAALTEEEVHFLAGLKN